MTTQKSVITTFNYFHGIEQARCPFCYTVITGKYTRFAGGEHLEVEEKCCHFEGFTNGGGLLTVAQFRGDAKDWQMMTEEATR